MYSDVFQSIPGSHEIDFPMAFIMSPTNICANLALPMRPLALGAGLAWQWGITGKSGGKFMELNCRVSLGQITRASCCRASEILLHLSHMWARIDCLSMSFKLHRETQHTTGIKHPQRPPIRPVKTTIWTSITRSKCSPFWG